MGIKEYLREKQKIVEQALECYLPPATPRFPQIHEAMRYSIFAGGKRLRPLLALMAGEVCGGTPEEVLPVACALEMIHTYSLIHDDLPAMDNDDFRRGKLSNHKQFGEAMAILAGDALLTQAFYIVAVYSPRKSQIPPLIEELAEASGSQGMVGGQVLDILSEGQSYDLPHLEQIHRSKTAALLRASLRLGAIAVGAESSQIKRLGDYGEHLGLAFQIKDDILDRTGSLEVLGKTPDKDQAQKKITYPLLMGLEKAQEWANHQAQAAIDSLGKELDCKTLVDLAHYVVERTS
jgi:geranylgeranyl diphosphate synthase type II